jgi:uncharacterized protein (DUF58 family)
MTFCVVSSSKFPHHDFDMLSPTRFGMCLLIGWLLFSVAAAFVPWLLGTWLYAGGLMGMLLVLDGLMLWLRKKPDFTRELPLRFALGEKGDVRLCVHNCSATALNVEVFDGIPPDATAAALPWRGLIPAGVTAQVTYGAILPQRGESTFSTVRYRMLGLLRLLKLRAQFPLEQTVKVYPNYAPVMRLSLLATEHRQEQMGIVRRSRGGSSKDFHQLREYRKGDSLSQIDWKATSRRLQLISRDYQEQRNQQIVFLLDSGRRMRSMDGGLPHFDHCLNALLLVSYVALRQGDHVAVQSFGGVDRWMPAVKGNHAMATILEHLYDAQATQSPSDFSEAAERLMMRFRRRALVIVMTNLRGEDAEEIIPALRSLQTRHLVVLASLCEGVVRNAAEYGVSDFSSALRHMAAWQYMAERREVLAHLQAHGILTLDVTAPELAVGLANLYLDIKSAGSL